LRAEEAQYAGGRRLKNQGKLVKWRFSAASQNHLPPASGFEERRRTL
jgi:hypothetical protein